MPTLSLQQAIALNLIHTGVLDKPYDDLLPQEYFATTPISTEENRLTLTDAGYEAAEAYRLPKELTGSDRKSQDPVIEIFIASNKLPTDEGMKLTEEYYGMNWRDTHLTKAVDTLAASMTNGKKTIFAAPKSHRRTTRKIGEAVHKVVRGVESFGLLLGEYFLTELEYKQIKAVARGEASLISLSPNPSPADMRAVQAMPAHLQPKPATAFHCRLRRYELEREMLGADPLLLL